MFEAFTPRHAKRYAEVGATIHKAMEQFVADIQSHAYPGPEHSFRIGSEALRQLQEYAEKR